MNENPVFEVRGPWGVPIQVGASLAFLFLVIFTLGGGSSEISDLYYDVVFFVVLVGSILLHELGHAWGCLIQGVPVRRVMLWGGGGFCEPSRSTSAYEDELIVAMGPIVNLALWSVASLAAPVLPGEELVWIAETIAHVNIFLALFNLMPVMPLDGGRLFHLFLLRLVSPGVAVRIAGGLGLVIAVLWVPLMIALYFWMGIFLAFLPPILLHWQMLTRRRF